MADVTAGLWVRMEAKPGMEAEVQAFLEGGRALVEEEPGTVTWFAVRLGPATFAIFDAFADEEGRRAHLSGKVAEALGARADELFAVAPAIEPVDVLASKLPG